MREFNCSKKDAQDCLGDNEIKRQWRQHIKESAKNNQLPIFVIKSFIATFSMGDYLTTFRGASEQNILRSLL